MKKCVSPTHALVGFRYGDTKVVPISFITPVGGAMPCPLLQVPAPVTCSRPLFTIPSALRMMTSGWASAQGLHQGGKSSGPWPSDPLPGNFFVHGPGLLTPCEVAHSCTCPFTDNGWSEKGVAIVASALETLTAKKVY